MFKPIFVLLLFPLSIWAAPIFEIGGPDMSYQRCKQECESVEGYHCERIGGSFVCKGPPGGGANPPRDASPTRGVAAKDVKDHKRGQENHYENESNIDDPCQYESSTECDARNDVGRE